MGNAMFGKFKLFGEAEKGSEMERLISRAPSAAKGYGSSLVSPNVMPQTKKTAEANPLAAGAEDSKEKAKAYIEQLERELMSIMELPAEVKDGRVKPKHKKWFLQSLKKRKKAKIQELSN